MTKKTRATEAAEAGWARRKVRAWLERMPLRKAAESVLLDAKTDFSFTGRMHLFFLVRRARLPGVTVRTPAVRKLAREVERRADY